jgi:hypothetical protein
MTRRSTRVRVGAVVATLIAHALVVHARPPQADVERLRARLKDPAPLTAGEADALIAAARKAAAAKPFRVTFGRLEVGPEFLIDRNGPCVSCASASPRRR